MEFIGLALKSIAGLASLVCFILVLVKMFQDGQTGLGVACIVLAFCCGVGVLITFIIGWVNARKWGIQNIMVIWSVCIAVGIFGNILAPPDFSRFQQIRAG